MLRMLRPVNCPENGGQGVQTPKAEQGAKTPGFQSHKLWGAPISFPLPDRVHCLLTVVGSYLKLALF